MLKFDIENVVSFKGYDVVNGEVSMENEEYADYLNEIYGSVEVCGQTFNAGDALQELDPTAFRCGKSDYESELDSELKDQLDRQDDSDIRFEDDDLPEDEEDEEEE